jgi:hypothetical protein
MTLSDYILVTNFWNATAKLRPVIENVAKQTRRPVHWYFIDDGSPDYSAHGETRDVAQELGMSIDYVYVFPTKTEGNKLTIGRAWDAHIPYMKELRADYLGVLDVDSRLPPEYFESLVTFLDWNPHVGVVSGVVPGEHRFQHMPMGGGRLVRWEVFDTIERMWDLAPDSFINIKSLAMGFENRSLEDVQLDAVPSTPRRGMDLAYRLHYCGNSIVTALYKALRQRDPSVFTDFVRLRRRGVPQCQDADVRYYYSKRRILRSLFSGKVMAIWV